MSAQTPLLQASSAGIRFGGIRALKDFEFSIFKGDLHGLIGPNGAGKTTAFNILTGVYQPTEGSVSVCGLKIAQLRPSKVNQLGIARTFQNIRLFKSMSALDNVLTVLRRSDVVPSVHVHGLGPKLLQHTKSAWRNYYEWWRATLHTSSYQREQAHDTEMAMSLLDVLGLKHRAYETAGSLPYGEQRRLEIARALATRPKVLLLDEPAAGMNTREKSDLMGLIERIKDEFSLGILVIEHDMKLVMGICQHITVLDQGSIIASGTPLEVKSNTKVIEAYLGEAAHG